MPKLKVGDYVKVRQRPGEIGYIQGSGFGQLLRNKIRRGEKVLIKHIQYGNYGLEDTQDGRGYYNFELQDIAPLKKLTIIVSED